MSDPDLNHKKYCGMCNNGDNETIRHILTECTASGRDLIWEEARSLWIRKGLGDWLKGGEFGIILTAGVIMCGPNGTSNEGAKRCLVIIISTACRCIWNIQCERAIPNEDGGPKREITRQEAKARWWLEIKKCFALDMVMTHERFDKLVIKPDLVRETWENLIDQEKTPEGDWFKTGTGVLLGSTSSDDDGHG